jgi:hypothetical protein
VIYTVVDLGAKKCGSLDAFRKYRKGTFGGHADVAPDKCLAVDINADCGATAKERGYNFVQADVLDPKFEWPSSMYYLAWDFLEHMPSINHSNYVLRKMVEHSSHGVWLRMPCFEPDTLDKLDRMGLRFTWTTWAVHASAYTVALATRVIESVRGWHMAKKMVSTKFVSSMDDRLVPKTAPSEVLKYDASMGPKSKIVFSPPISAAFDLIGIKASYPIPIERWDKTYEKILGFLRSGTPFAFNRFGDGEWAVILAFDPEWTGRFSPSKRVSCGLQVADHALAAALVEALRARTRGFFGLQPLAARVMGDAISEWLIRHEISEPSWLESDALHRASDTKRLQEFVDVLRTKTTILVGPSHLATIKDLLRSVDHVVVPDTDCWSSVADIEAELEQSIRKAGSAGVCLVSAGPTAKVLIHRMSMQFKSWSFVDTGAVWDVYVGRKTRAYHAKVDTGQLT